MHEQNNAPQEGGRVYHNAFGEEGDEQVVYVQVDAKEARMKRYLGNSKYEDIPSGKFSGYLESTYLNYEPANIDKNIKSHYALNFKLKNQDTDGLTKLFQVAFKLNWVIYTPNLLNALASYAMAPEWIYMRVYMKDGYPRLALKMGDNPADAVRPDNKYPFNEALKGYEGVPVRKYLATDDDGRKIYDSKENLAFWLEEYIETVYPKINGKPFVFSEQRKYDPNHIDPRDYINELRGSTPAATTKEAPPEIFKAFTQKIVDGLKPIITTDVLKIKWTKTVPALVKNGFSTDQIKITATLFNKKLVKIGVLNTVAQPDGTWTIIDSTPMENTSSVDDLPF